LRQTRDRFGAAAAAQRLKVVPRSELEVIALGVLADGEPFLGKRAHLLQGYRRVAERRIE
jgi:hypothetical protein